MKIKLKNNYRKEFLSSCIVSNLINHSKQIYKENLRIKRKWNQMKLRIF